MTTSFQLVADIGGTHARFGLVPGGPGSTVADIATLKVAEHATPQAAAQAYLAQVSRREGGAIRLSGVALALATAIEGDTAKMTNSAWVASRTEIARALGTDRVLLLNDFEALAYALPQLADDADAGSVRWFGEPRPDRSLPMAAIGPGTGLGVAGCVPSRGGWVALAAEGGHVTAAAADDFESELLRELRAEFGHVSAERVLSGIGLPSLHRAVCRVRGVAPAQIETLEAAEIARRAREAADVPCRETLDTFSAMLGSFAGNVALTIGARGGVFIGGGIVPKLGELFDPARFRRRFEAKGRFEGYMARIATGVIIAPHPALAGAARALAQHG